AMFHIPPLLVPWQDPSTWDRLVWSNYPTAFTFTRPPFLVFIWNTLVIAGLAMCGALFSSPLAAYGLSRVRWPGRGILFGIALFEFLNRWRDFFGPLLFLTKKETYTISLGLNFYR